TAQYSRLVGMYCTSRCHGTKPGCTRVTGDGVDQCMPSLEMRRSTTVDCVLQPPFTAFTDHIRQAPFGRRTTAGDTIAMPVAFATDTGWNQCSPSGVVCMRMSSVLSAVRR